MSAPLRILLVDDEPLALERLEMLLAREQGLSVVGSAVNGTQALALAEMHGPDVCLLDIAMPDVSGIEVAQRLAVRPDPPKVIFVTAFDDFAVTAFAIDAVDYLLKPVAPARLQAALARARERLGSGPPAPRDGIDEFWVSDQVGLRRIAAVAVDRLTAERDYVRLHVGHRSWLLNDSMARLEHGLDPAAFLRIHRGTIVNRRTVAGLRRETNGWKMILADGSEHNVGRAYQGAVGRVRGRHN